MTSYATERLIIQLQNLVIYKNKLANITKKINAKQQKKSMPKKKKKFVIFTMNYYVLIYDLPNPLYVHA